MKLDYSTVQLIEETDPFLKIEKIGRTCYKSNNKISQGSAYRFYDSLVKHGHHAMLEHACFVFEVSRALFDDVKGYRYLNRSVEIFANGSTRYLVSGNLRAINESHNIYLLQVLATVNEKLVYVGDDMRMSTEFIKSARLNNEYKARLVSLKDIPNLQFHAYMIHRYFTFDIVCDRGVSHELVRHRPCSFAQESTRYCNYAGKEMTFIYPSTYHEWDDESKIAFEQSLKTSEAAYNKMISQGLKPEQARAILPNALSTEIIMTANCCEWEHFFDLRSRAVTGKPHPDMKRIADFMLSIYSFNVAEEN